MTVRPILVWPDPELLKPSLPVLPGEDVSALIQDLKDTLAASEHGIGLAAPQIGVHKRVVVVQLDLGGVTMVTPLINPVISNPGPEVDGVEGCLSVPDFSGTVKRAETCTVTFAALTGEVASLGLVGFESVLVQHEVDHLDGRVYVQYLGKAKRDFIRKKLAKRK